MSCCNWICIKRTLIKKPNQSANVETAFLFIYCLPNPYCCVCSFALLSKNQKFALFASDSLNPPEKYSFCRRVLSGNRVLISCKVTLDVVWSQLISLYTKTKFIYWSLNSLLCCDYQRFFNFKLFPWAPGTGPL